ncbi:hypothetical protein FOA52_004950 [Chlamydomonas sp. UWO 241]|nr:hypothetical protein FOA52_004950 [Chlamydomonas sp. UWO 241]
MQLRSVARRQAAPPAVEPAPEWEALPQGVWVQVAAQLNTGNDLWALTQACKCHCTRLGRTRSCSPGARCANMVTAEDLTAEGELSRIGQGLWDGFVDGFGALKWKPADNGSSWTIWASDTIEEVVRMVQEHGTRLFESDAPATLEIWVDHTFEKAIVDDDCKLVDLSDWIEAHEEELGAPLAEALLEME